MKFGFASLWHFLSLPWALEHDRLFAVFQLHWYIDWRVFQTFNHLKAIKTWQEPPAKMCSDLRAKGNLKTRWSKPLQESRPIWRKQCITKMSHKLLANHPSNSRHHIPLCFAKETRTYSQPHRSPENRHWLLFPGRPSEHHGATCQDHSPSSKSLLSHGNHYTRSSPDLREKASQRGKNPHLAMQWHCQTSSLVGYNLLWEFLSWLNAESPTKTMCGDRN